MGQNEDQVPAGQLLLLTVTRQDVPEHGEDGMVALGAGVSQQITCSSTGELVLVLKVVQQVERRLRTMLARDLAHGTVDALMGVLDALVNVGADDGDSVDSKLDSFDPEQWTPGVTDDQQVTATHDYCGQVFGVMEAMLGDHQETCPKAPAAAGATK